MIVTFRSIGYLLSQRVSSLDCFMKSNSSSHHQDLIRVRLPHNLGLADSEDLVIGIDHRGGGPAHTEETDLAERDNIDGEFMLYRIVFTTSGRDQFRD